MQMPVYNAFCGLTGANLCLVARLTNRLQQIIDNTSLRCFICRSLKKGDRMKKVIMWAGMDLPIPFQEQLIPLVCKRCRNQHQLLQTSEPYVLLLTLTIIGNRKLKQSKAFFFEDILESLRAKLKQNIRSTVLPILIEQIDHCLISIQGQEQCQKEDCHYCEEKHFEGRTVLDLQKQFYNSMFGKLYRFYNPGTNGSMPTSKPWLSILSVMMASQNQFELSMLRNLLIMINAFKEEENLAQATERSLKGYVNRQMCFLIDETLCRKIITDIWRRSVQQRDVYEPNKHKDLEEEILVRMEMPYYGQPIRLKVSSGGFVSKLAVRLSWVPINEINQTSKRSPGFMDLNLLITPSLGTEHFVRTEIGSEKYKENGTQQNYSESQSSYSELFELNTPNQFVSRKTEEQEQLSVCENDIIMVRMSLENQTVSCRNETQQIQLKKCNVKMVPGALIFLFVVLKGVKTTVSILESP